MGLEVGQRVGDYEILSVLGAGGMGQVYRVRNTLSDRVEAMKVLLPRLTAEPETAARFMAEIRTLASFNHPNIAQLRTAFHLENQLVMVMELVEGLTVEYKTKRGRVPQEESLGYVLQLLSALSYSHARGVIHRDIKPANLMITRSGVVKLMDFGIAKSEVQAQLTRPGTTVGSLPYMSPEQMRGGPVDARSDLYSVGILLYELLTGIRPFENNAVYSIVHQQLNTAPRPPIEVNPSIPRPLNDLILRTLSKEPAARLQSAEAFGRELRALTPEPPRVKQEVPHRAVSPRSSNLPEAPIARAAPRARAAEVFLTPAAVASPPVLNARTAPQEHSPSSSFWQRVGWVGAGAFGVILLAAAAVEIPLLLRSNATADAVPDVPSSASTNNSSGTLNPELALAREQMLQLESRANAIHTKLGSRPNTPTTGAHPELDKQYTQMRFHLQSAESELKNRDIVATRRDMAKVRKELSALETNIGQ